MTLIRLPSGNWTAKVWLDGKDASVNPILGLSKGTTVSGKREAKALEAKAREILRARRHDGATVGQFWERWTTDPLFARPRESTNIHNRERTKAFAQRYAAKPLDQVTRQLVINDWLAGGHHNSTVSALRAMFNDAIQCELTDRNPFASLKIRKATPTRRPPTQEQLENMILLARELTPPSFAGYLEFACCCGARPSELDALRWERVRFEDDEIDLVEQWNTKTQTFTEPKYGPYTVSLVGRARDVLLALPPEDSPFVFVSNRRTHYTTSSRIYHWNRVRCAAGLPHLAFYAAERHYFAWYALNVLGLPPHIVAVQLGHKDGGKLIVQTYGHPDESLARRQIREAFDRAANVTPLRVVRKDSA